MGRIRDEHYDHEGYVACVFPDGVMGSSYSGMRVGADYRPDGTLIEPDEETWRPEAEVIGWRAACGCGWVTGPLWMRAATPGDQDLGARVMYADEALLSSEEEERVMADWDAHMGPVIAASALSEASADFDAARRRLENEVIAARSTNPPMTWDAIGRAVGTSRQSAHERFGRLVPASA